MFLLTIWEVTKGRCSIHSYWFAACGELLSGTSTSSLGPLICRFHLPHPDFPYLDEYLEKPVCTVVSLGKGSTLGAPPAQSCVSVLSAGRS